MSLDEPKLKLHELSAPRVDLHEVSVGLVYEPLDSIIRPQLGGQNLLRSSLEVTGEFSDVVLNLVVSIPGPDNGGSPV
jgi:hypothetical protein